ncbi:MAG TPA: hypothetical protein VF519_02105 [Mycobacteriales bacterium]|jgi:hypothetical protein
MRELSREDARALAAAYEPALYFAAGERWFPVQVESWLSHASADRRRSDGFDLPVESPAGPLGRGTSLWAGGVRVSDAPTPAGEALGPDEVARLANAPADAFLSFGGWPEAHRQRGDAAYLHAAFSEYAAAMDPTANTEAAFERDQADRPVVWHAQPTTPTTYCEVEWAGGAPGLNDREAGTLRRCLALTYHWFFPMREEVAFPHGQGNAEGQWEAATVFLLTPEPEEREGAARPVFTYGKNALDEFVPYAVALSRPEGRPPAARAWSRVHRTGRHPMLAVSYLSHRLEFAPVSAAGAATFRRDEIAAAAGGAPGAAPQTRLPAEDYGRDNGPFNDFWGTALFFVGVALASPFIVAVAIVARIFGAKNDKHSGDPDEPAPSMPSPARADAGGAVARPADASGPPGTVVVPDPVGAPWVAYRVDDPAVSILRVVDRFHPVEPKWWAADESGSAPPTTETPPWWDYPGRWGAAVTGLLVWAPGTRRTDAGGDSLGRRNTRALAHSWALPDPNAPRPVQG